MPASVAAVDRDDDTGLALHGRLDGAERETVTLFQPAGHVWLHVQAESPQRGGHDRQPGQSVRVEITEHEDRLPALPCRDAALEEGRRIGEEQRIVQPVRGRGGEGHELRRGGQASGVEDGDQPGRQPNAIPRLEELRSDDCAGRETPPIGRLDHVAEDATPAFTASCVRVRRVDTGPVGGLDQVAARLGERPASVFSLRRCSHSCQVTRIGLALKIDE